MDNNSKSDSTRVFFVRHGVTDQTGKALYGQMQGIHLNEEGLEQARQIAEYFEPVHVDAIFSSPLERAYQTAQVIGKGRNVEITTRDELKDTDVGAWTNMLFEECSEFPEWKAVQGVPSQFCFPEGESFVDVFDRMSTIVRSIVSFNKGKNVVITCHRDPIIILLASYLGVHMDSFQRIPCKPASLTEVVFTNGIARVESINVLPAQRMV